MEGLESIVRSATDEEGKLEPFEIDITIVLEKVERHKDDMQGNLEAFLLIEDLAAITILATV